MENHRKCHVFMNSVESCYWMQVGALAKLSRCSWGTKELTSGNVHEGRCLMTIATSTTNCMRERDVLGYTPLSTPQWSAVAKENKGGGCDIPDFNILLLSMANIILISFPLFLVRTLKATVLNNIWNNQGDMENG